MRLTVGRPGHPARRNRFVTAVVASALLVPVLVTTVAVAPSALAEKADPAFPSKAQVRAAQERAAAAADSVAAVKARLAAANARLEDAALRAEQAAEAWNGARWQLEQATATYREATASARRADASVGRQRDRLAGLVAASYQDAGDLTALNAVMGSQGPEGMMGQMLAYEGASSSMDARFQRFSATAALATVFRRQAAAAQAKQQKLLAAAETARREAESAAAAAQAEAATVAQEKEQLVRRMAQLEGVSVRLATRRQAALEEIERKRRERAAAAAAQAAAQAAQAAAQAAQQHDQQGNGGGQTSSPSTPPAPAPGTAPPTSGGAAAAVAFARAQLGERYVWGAAGPDAWDCSGLMMGAWRAGGVSLPHYSAAQYAASTPISSADLRPGDLVFWGTSSSPGSIHHVAMYLGDGLIIHAPRTGRPVSIDSMYYWIPPNFFGRV